MNTTRKITVVCGAASSGDDPLIYVVDIPADLLEGSPYDPDILGGDKHNQILHEVAVQRAIDRDEDFIEPDELILFFAFDGDVSTLIDWRS